MSLPCPTSRTLPALLLAGALAGCGQAGAPPVRAPAHGPALSVGPEPVSVSSLHPGATSSAPPDPRGSLVEGDVYRIAAGKRYFTWYNCNGCHFSGGGGIGPALMDDKWIYGDRLDQIYSSIAEGRPNGMPTWAGKIPDAQIWELAAYVKSLSSPDSLRRDAQSQTPLEPATLSGTYLVPKTLG